MVKQVQTLIVDQSAYLSLKCDLGLPRMSPDSPREIVWLSNGIHLHSSSNSDVLNISVASLDLRGSSVRLSCANRMISSGESFQANQLRLLHSSNMIELKLPGKFSDINLDGATGSITLLTQSIHSRTSAHNRETRVHSGHEKLQ